MDCQPPGSVIHSHPGLRRWCNSQLCGILGRSCWSHHCGCGCADLAGEAAAGVTSLADPAEVITATVASSADLAGDVTVGVASSADIAGDVMEECGKCDIVRSDYVDNYDDYRYDCQYDDCPDYFEHA